MRTFPIADPVRPCHDKPLVKVKFIGPRPVPAQVLISAPPSACTLSFSMRGVVEHIFIAPKSGEPMCELTQVAALRGCGLRGDRYMSRTGYWCGVDECQVTFIEGEILDRIAEDHGLMLGQGQHRRNIVTRGIRLAQLLGKTFAVGDAVFEYDRPRPPCSHLQSLHSRAVVRVLFGQRGGIGARVVKSGLIRTQDEIFVLGHDPRSL